MIRFGWLGLALALAACGESDNAPFGTGDAGPGPVDASLRLDASIGSDAGVSSDAGVALPPRPLLGAQIDRVGRPVISRILIAPFESESVSDPAHDAYNFTEPTGWPVARIPIAESLAVYDALDGQCGNQLLADPIEIPERYFALAATLADDRIWVNAASVDCRQYLAVELAANGIEPSFAPDCGGRAPSYDVIDTTYSILSIGSWTGVSDGVDSDDGATTSTFPFLAPPDP